MDPAAHVRPGTSKVINATKCYPRTSKELQEHMVEYALLQQCFQEVFEFIAKAVWHLLFYLYLFST